MVLGRQRAVEPERTIWPLRVGELNDGAMVDAVGGKDHLPGGQAGRCLHLNGPVVQALILDLEAGAGWIRHLERPLRLWRIERLVGDMDARWGGEIAGDVRRSHENP